MPAGRPTDYRTEYCDEVVSFMADGRHVIEFAAHINVAKSTVYKWAEEIPEFSDALKKAQTKSMAWWINLDKNKASGINSGGSDTLIIHMLKCKDREEFGDRPVEEKKIDNVSILGAVSSETLGMIAKDLVNAK